MNRLNKIFVSFVLLVFCLLFNVSYASFTSTPVPWGDSWSAGNTSNGNSQLGNYTLSQVKIIVNSWKSNPNDDFYYQTFLTMVENLKTAGFKTIVTEGNFNSVDYYYCVVVDNNVEVAFNGSYILFTSIDGTDGGYVYFSSPFSDVYYKNKASFDKACRVNAFPGSPIIYCNMDIKNVVWLSGLVWDGTYYYEVPTEPEEDTPSLPSNAEIAQAVQAFYNSDYYKNNKDFKEFFVLYNSSKGIYSFIGHNSVGEIANHFKYGSTLSQHIYSANYPTNTTGLRYWNFNLETLGSQISNFLNNYYWLYSSFDNGSSFNYDGKGYITDLIKIKFDSRYSTIVYSSTDYLCRVYEYENEEETTNDATVPGDQYTYDENLDPTTNEYNPLENFVPVDPSQSILGDVDFDEINKTFEENKNILNIENASWLFSANNRLVGYFIGFLSILIIFLIISRILGG